jgi:hypothetical protein
MGHIRSHEADTVWPNDPSWAAESWCATSWMHGAADGSWWQPGWADGSWWMNAASWSSGWADGSWWQPGWSDGSWGLQQAALAEAAAAPQAAQPELTSEAEAARQVAELESDHEAEAARPTARLTSSEADAAPARPRRWPAPNRAASSSSAAAPVVSPEDNLPPLQMPANMMLEDEVPVPWRNIHEQRCYTYDFHLGAFRCRPCNASVDSMHLFSARHSKRFTNADWILAYEHAEPCPIPPRQFHFVQFYSDDYGTRDPPVDIDAYRRWKSHMAPPLQLTNAPHVPTWPGPHADLGNDLPSPPPPCRGCGLSSCGGSCAWANRA